MLAMYPFVYNEVFAITSLELAENIVKDKKSKTPIKQLRGTAEAVPDAVPLVHTKPSNLDNFVKFTSNQMEHTKPTEPVVNPTTTFVPNTIQVNAVGTALLVICSSHRPDYLQRTLSYVLKFHPRIGFPIIISEDGASPKVKSIIDTFRKEIQCTSVDINHEGGFERSKLYMPSSTTITDGTAVPVVHLHHPMSHERAENGYFKLSKHFKYALGVVFDHNSHESFAQFQSMPSPYLSGQMLISPIGFQRVIILEEDIQISPDFFEYFSSVTNMVDNDETILCASAWNDNGFSSLINPTVDRDKLVRSDFFPGLGWMLTKKLWVNELCAKWPRAYWDDWLREPPQRKNRHTIRPEICRTYHFGAKGVSGGQYNSYLNDISLNEQFQPFTSLNLDYLEETAWNSDKYMNLVRNSEIVTKQTFPVKRDEILNRKLNAEQSLRIIYTSLDGREPTSFVSLAKWLKCMDNIKAHVPRTAYKGIVSLWKEGVKLHITPAAI